MSEVIFRTGTKPEMTEEFRMPSGITELTNPSVVDPDLFIDLWSWSRVSRMVSREANTREVLL